MAVGLKNEDNIKREKAIINKDNYNALCVGIGGTGVIRVSMILGWAALRQGYKVRTAETHGMSQRGGSVSSYLRFGRNLESPFMVEGDLDVLLAFEISEALRNLHFVNKDTFIIASSNSVIPPSSLTHKSLKIDDSKCIGCGNCLAHCIPNQIYRDSNNSQHYFTLIKGPTRIIRNGISRVLESCTGCVRCIIDKVCPFAAIQAYNDWEYPEVALIEKDIRSVVQDAIIIDAEKIAIEEGNILTANVILVGILAGIKKIPLSEEILKETVKQFIPKKALDVNLNAFNRGREIGLAYKKI